MDRARQSRRAAASRARLTRRREKVSVEGAARAQKRAEARGAPERSYFVAAPAAAYFLRNLSTRPAVSTIFCLPV
jgi:hypothetical protein